MITIIFQSIPFSYINFAISYFASETAKLHSNGVNNTDLLRELMCESLM